MELIDNPQTLIEQITNLTRLNQIIETVVVNESIGTIEVSKTIKEVDSIRQINEEISYKLKTTRLLIRSNQEKSLVISDTDDQTITKNSKLCDCIARNTNMIFSKECSKLKNAIKYNINYFSQSLFKKIFNKTKKKDVFDLIDQIGEKYSWVAIPLQFKNLFDDDKNFFKSETEDQRIIHIYGRYKNLSIYVNVDQSQPTMYFGKYDSLTLIINKNFLISDIKTLSEIYTEGKNISIEYLFIENQPISSLTII